MKKNHLLLRFWQTRRRLLCSHNSERQKYIIWKKCIVELFAKKNPQEKGKPWTFGCHIRLTSTRFCWCWPTWNQSKTQLCTGQNFWKVFCNYSNIGRYIFIVWSGKKIDLWLISILFFSRGTCSWDKMWPSKIELLMFFS